jgi:hypothetical protein
MRDISKIWSEAWKQHFEIDNKILIYKIAYSNYTLLSELIQSYGKGNYPTIVFSGMDKEYSEFNFQLAFHLFNFLNSGISIMEQVESTYVELYEGKELITSFNERIKAFWKVRENAIVKGLRNLSSHTSSSFITTSMSRVIGELPKYNLIIDKNAISAYEDWQWGKRKVGDTYPKKIILESEGDIELGSLLHTFFINVTEYFHWFIQECIKSDNEAFKRVFERGK